MCRESGDLKQRRKTPMESRSRLGLPFLVPKISLSTKLSFRFLTLISIPLVRNSLDGSQNLFYMQVSSKGDLRMNSLVSSALLISKSKWLSCKDRVVVWFKSKISPQNTNVEGLVTILWCCWEVVEPLRGGPNGRKLGPCSPALAKGY